MSGCVLLAEYNAGFGSIDKSREMGVLERVVADMTPIRDNPFHLLRSLPRTADSPGSQSQSLGAVLFFLVHIGCGIHDLLAFPEAHHLIG